MIAERCEAKYKKQKHTFDSYKLFYSDIRAHLRSSSGSTRVGFQSVLQIMDNCSYKIKSDSFLSYQLVKVDLLVCMPALGVRIKVGLDEIDTTLHVYAIF